MNLKRWLKEYYKISLCIIYAIILISAVVFVGFIFASIIAGIGITCLVIYVVILEYRIRKYIKREKREKREIREIRNYILIAMGFAVICLMFLFHLLSPINTLLHRYNNLIDYVNKKYNTTHSHQSVIFFGETMESIVVLIDTIIVVIVVIIILMVYLTIRWSFKESKKSERNEQKKK